MIGGLILDYVFAYTEVHCSQTYQNPSGFDRGFPITANTLALIAFHASHFLARAVHYIRAVLIHQLQGERKGTGVLGCKCGEAEV